MKGRLWLGLILLPLLGLGWWFCLPEPLFQVPYSVVLTQEGRLAGVRPALDGQIRFPVGKAVPGRLAACITAFEDRRFYGHHGLDWRGVARALWSNIRAGRVRQGGSTLSMQVVRMASHRRGRSVVRKVVEALQATRLEARYSKQEILALWAGHAPFGGNVAGLEAAAWRYFGQPAEALTWAESATLAVLPNAPGLMHPGRSRGRLKAKRDSLLAQLARQGTITKDQLSASVAEELPSRPVPLPNAAPHLLAAARSENPDGAWREVTLSTAIQALVEEALAHQRPYLATLDVGNAAVIVAELSTGRVLAYVGNTGDSAHAAYVDAAQAPRSYGSLLKPFLLAHALDRGLVTPQAWLEDVPKLYGTFAPRNYYNEYEGVVPAGKALARSLNLPFVALLDVYGQRRFCLDMRQAGLGHLNRPPENYGLAMILGSAEATLWEMARLYTASAQEVLGRPRRFGVWADSLKAAVPVKTLPTAQSLETVFAALSDANRPELDPYWQQIARALPIAWKTGTSQGLRDAWAIGCTSRYTIAVWCGNADGEGRPGLTGIHVAAPILFEIAARLEPPGAGARPGNPFERPAGLRLLRICKVSGWPAGPFCLDAASESLPVGCAKTAVCPYHRQVFLDAGANHRVEAGCYPLAKARPTSELHLPPLQDYYARRAQNLPRPYPWLAACAPQGATEIQLLTPTNRAILTLPEPDGPSNQSTLLLAASTTQPQQGLYWYLDGRALGKTEGTARQSMKAGLGPGTHHLVVLAEDGGWQEATFETR